MSDFARKIAKIANKASREDGSVGDKARAITMIARSYGVEVIPEDLIYPTPCHMVNFCLKSEIGGNLYGVRGLKSVPTLISGILDHNNLESSRSMTVIQNAWKSVIEDYRATGMPGFHIGRVVLIFRIGGHLMTYQATEWNEEAGPGIGWDKIPHLRIPGNDTRPECAIAAFRNILPASEADL